MSKRTIERVIDKRDGTEINAIEFFKRPFDEIWDYRRLLQEAYSIEEKPTLFTCAICNQKIKIVGRDGGSKILHFKHFKDNLDCPIKTNSSLSKEEVLRTKFNGAKESFKHIETKNLIYQALLSNKNLKKGVSYAETEKRHTDKSSYLNWRRPDISSKYKNKDLVFEVQLSTTFISVIVERENFYFTNKTYILWVFKNFPLNDFRQRFSDKDIFYSNNRNAFVFDDEAKKLSNINNDLYLLCHYQKPFINKNKIENSWESTYINIGQLYFNEVSFKIFYFDYDKTKEELSIKLNNILLKEKEDLDIYLKLEAEKKLKLFKEEQNLKEQLRKIERSNNEKETNDYYNDLAYKHHNEEFYKSIPLTLNTELQDILNNHYYIINENVLLLFRNKNLDEKEIGFLTKSYHRQNKIFEGSDNSDCIHLITKLIFLYKLKKRKLDLSKINNILNFLFAILSFKEKKVFGSHYKNLKSVFHFYSNPRGRFYGYRFIFLRAIDNYYKGGLSQFIIDNNNDNKIKLKIRKIRNEIESKQLYEEHILAIFPKCIKINKNLLF